MLRTLTKSIREYRGLSILASIIIFIETIIECTLPFITANLVDYFSGNLVTGEHEFTIFNIIIETTATIDVTHILVYGVILLSIALFSVFLGASGARIAAAAAAGFGKNLRGDIYCNIQEFSFENIDKFSTSSLITRLTTDITNIQNAYIMIIRTGVRAILLFTFSFIMALNINLGLALIMLISLPFLVVLVTFLLFKVMPKMRKVFKKYDNMNMRVQENLHGIRVVKTFVREEDEIKKFEASAEDIRKNFTSVERNMAIISPFVNLLLYSLILVIGVVGAIIIVQTSGAVDVPWYGSLTTGGLSSIIVYLIMSFMALGLFAMVLVMVTMALESGRRISEVLEEKSTIVSPSDGVKEVADGSISFNDVSFSYAGDEQYSLHNIDINIESGMTVGIIGMTGSGKTTLVNLIPRLYDVSLGKVCVGGVDVRDYNTDVLRKGVAIVLQKNILFSGTVKENLCWGNLNATDEQIEKACKMAQAHDFIELMPNGYNTMIEQAGKNVSGGQRQRLCIARALLTDPKILILDDSTSALDTKTDAFLRNEIAKHNPDLTKIIIAQRVDSIKNADMIVVMDMGKINQIGTHEELVANNEIYRDVCKSQSKEGY